MKRTLWMLGMLALLGLSMVPASATILLDFSTADAGNVGTITLGAGNTGKGSGIGIDSLAATGTGADGTYDVDGAVTTLVTSGEAGGLVGSLDFCYDPTGAGGFGPCNSVTVTGSIPGLGVPQEVLLTGSFATFTATKFGIIGSINGGGPDTKSADLLTALGVPVTTAFNFFGFSIGMNTTGGNTFTAFSTDISNTDAPEPASIILLGTLITGIVGVVRRRTAKV